MTDPGRRWASGAVAVNLRNCFRGVDLQWSRFRGGVARLLASRMHQDAQCREPALCAWLCDLVSCTRGAGLVPVSGRRGRCPVGIVFID